MATIDGGQFFMGSDDPKADDDEKPAHNVTLSPFCIDLKEVTVAQYKECSDNGKCKRAATEVWWPEIEDADKKLYSPLCNINDPVGKAQHPINCVDWDMAKAFCDVQGKRLPTEAEWEYAARGPDGRIYPWGDDPPDARHLNACGSECVDWEKKNKVKKILPPMYDGNDGYPITAPVGSFPLGASRYGLLDVVGNVWEWAGDYEGRYESGAQTDPTGPSEGKERVIRGGAWNGSFPSWVRPSQRYSYPPESKTHVIGFRCAESQSAVGGKKPAK
jgi:formylglycine-generating enzyme required for sulfatase activity